MQFGFSFDYSSATWDGYYEIKSSLGGSGPGIGQLEDQSDDDASFDEGDRKDGAHVARAKGGREARRTPTSGDPRPRSDHLSASENDDRSDSRIRSTSPAGAGVGGDVDAGGGSPLVLFSSDGFRLLERYTATAQSAANAAEMSRQEGEEEENEIFEEETVAAGGVDGGDGGGDASDDDDGDGKNGSSGPRGGGGGSNPGGWGGRLKRQGRKIFGWIRSLPVGGTFGGQVSGGQSPGSEGSEVGGRDRGRVKISKTRRLCHRGQSGEGKKEVGARQLRRWRHPWEAVRQEHQEEGRFANVLTLSSGVTSRMVCLLISFLERPPALLFMPMLKAFCERPTARGSARSLSCSTLLSSWGGLLRARTVVGEAMHVPHCCGSIGGASHGAHVAAEVVAAAGEEAAPGGAGTCTSLPRGSTLRRGNTVIYGGGDAPLAELRSSSLASSAPAALIAVVGTQVRPVKNGSIFSVAGFCASPGKHAGGVRCRATAVIATSTAATAMLLAAAAGVRLDDGELLSWRSTAAFAGIEDG